VPRAGFQRHPFPNKIEPVKMFIIALVALTAPPLAAVEISTSDRGTIRFGPFSTGNWRDREFEGSSSRNWTHTGEAFSFEWDTRKGNQIGSIGVSYGSPHLQNAAWEGVRVRDIPAAARMSADARWTPKKAAWFYWAIYGWTHRAYTYWGSEEAPDGHEVEFYIIFHTDTTREAFLEVEGCTPRGSVDVEGMVFDCYTFPKEHFTQWFAVLRSDGWPDSPAVDLKPIFDYWCRQGLDPDQYVTSLSWALEAFAGTAGRLELENVVIPDLTPE